ncbi:uncharacterized mitochondrial protein AtMg00810-like [Humulus lupulus]|uniref:uncharacterized mitochondrial protein AtMg00810-like n=1 Tax=Humulus lupulus TaxID=3486 RepID=UPI002B4131AB|nr:uncharacterized mitochondrial protein AtMg00810-like [Humulus lupulus]
MVTRSKNGVFKPKAFLTNASNIDLEPLNVKSALGNPTWQQTMQIEFQVLLDNNTRTLVPFSPDMAVVSNKWVFRVKYHPDGSVDRYKQVDVNNAFLNGVLQEVMYMQQPPGFINKEFPHHADTSLFFTRKHNKLLIVLVYVDDILITSEDKAQIHRLITDLHLHFALKVLGSVQYFLGFEVCRDSFGLYLSQRKYIKDLLHKVNLSDAKPQPTPMCSYSKLSLSSGALLADPKMYRSVIGALQYLTMTRPNTTFAINRLSQFLSAPTTTHWAACKRVLRYLIGTQEFVPCFKPSTHLDLQGFTDADWAGCLDDRRSTSGYCVFLGGNLISWCSKKQQVVSISSTEAEYKSLALATTELIWLK